MQVSQGSEVGGLICVLARPAISAQTSGIQSVDLTNVRLAHHR